MICKTVYYRLKDIKFPKQNLIIRDSFLGKETSYKYDWQNLKKSLVEDGYNPEKYCYIEISKDGYLYDGHHRTSVLQEIFINDNEKEILVRKSIFNYNTDIFVFVIPSLIILPVIWLFDKIFGFLFKTKSIFK